MLSRGAAQALAQSNGAMTVLEALDVDVPKLRAEVTKGAKQERELAVTGGREGGALPTLAQCGTDLTQAALDGKLDPTIGRADEITRVMQTLVRRRKNNPCLIGDPGVGKTAIAEGLAQRIASNDDVPPRLRGMRVLTLEIATLVAGTKYRGERGEPRATRPPSLPVTLFPRASTRRRVRGAAAERDEGESLRAPSARARATCA